MNANISVHEPKPPDDPDSALAFSMEGYDGQPPAPLVPRFWAPAWNSVQAVTRFQEEVNGPLRGGPEGKRLIEPPESDHFKFFEDAPKPFERRNGQYLLVPVHYTFGSDELSMLTPGVAHRAPQPHIAISTDDARQLDLIPSSNAEVIVDGISLQLPVEISAGIPAGLAALPAGLPQLQSIMLPGWGSIAKARTA